MRKGLIKKYIYLYKRFKEIIIVVIFIVSLLAGLSLIGFRSKKIIKAQSYAMLYWDINIREKQYLRDSNKFAVSNIVDNHSIVVMGSSEFYMENDLSYPRLLYQGNKYKMLMIGDCFRQGLIHTLDIGALSEILPNRKVVLILSPQWYEQDMSSEKFTEVFQLSSYFDFMENRSISYELKRNVASQVVNLLKCSPDLMREVMDINDVCLGIEPNPLKRLSVMLLKRFTYYKCDYQLAQIVRDIDISEKNIYRDEFIDYDSLIKQSDELGRNLSQNELGVWDKLYYLWQKNGTIAKIKDIGLNRKFNSNEYGFLELFISVCKETNITPLIISVPVQGKAYDYMNWSKEARNEYYEKIRNICNSNNVKLADFSNMEYEPDFIADTSHLGIKGWAYVDKVIYDFYKENIYE